MRHPWCVDLFCGRGGWTKGFIAAGWRVTGVDIAAHPDYPKEAELIVQDMLTVDGARFAGCTVIVASPPCEEFSRFRMPWTRSRHPPEPSLALVEAARRIAREAEAKVFIMENVREAQRWLGPAVLQRAGRYLWGDVVLAPMVQAKAKESYSSDRRDLRSEIPFEMSYWMACALKLGLAVDP